MMNKQVSKCTVAELEEKFYELDKQIAILKTVQFKDIESISTALKLQATEYERRLSLLNGEAERLKSMQISYLPREIWEQSLKEQQKEIGILTAFKDNYTGRNSIISGIVAFAVSLIFLIINYMLSR